MNVYRSSTTMQMDAKYKAAKQSRCMTRVITALRSPINGTDAVIDPIRVCTKSNVAERCSLAQHRSVNSFRPIIETAARAFVKPAECACANDAPSVEQPGKNHHPQEWQTGSCPETGLSVIHHPRLWHEWPEQSAAPGFAREVSHERCPRSRVMTRPTLCRSTSGLPVIRGLRIASPAPICRDLFGSASGREGKPAPDANRESVLGPDATQRIERGHVS